MMGVLRSDLPVSADPAGRFLPWLVSIMVFLAAMALAGAMTLDGMLDRWSADLSGTLTVQIPPATDQASGRASKAETDARVERAVRLLRSLPAIASADAVSEERLTQMLEPWLGSRDLIGELPVPRLIDVALKPGATPDLGEVRARLHDVAPGAVIDDHRVWLSKLIRLAEGLRWLAWAILVLVAAATTATVIHATRSALAVHRPHVEVLHLIGATDSYIAGQFARRALVHGVIGGLGGLAVAAPALWGVGVLVQRLQGGLIPAVSLTWGQIALLGLLAPVAGAVAMVSAHQTVRRQLARML